MGRILPSDKTDRKSTRLNSSHTEIYTLSLHDALPISRDNEPQVWDARLGQLKRFNLMNRALHGADTAKRQDRSEEHTSELQSHRDLHSFPTRRSSDLPR